MRKTTLVAVVAGLLTLAGCTSVVHGHNQGLAEGGVTPQSLPSGLPTGVPTDDGSGSPSPTDSTSEAPTGTPGKQNGLDIHAPMSITNDRGLRATARINSTKYSTTPNASYGEKPENGTFLVLNVTLSTQADSLPVNPLYFVYQVPGGKSYHVDDGTAIFAGFEPELHANDLDAGKSITGNVTFDIPKTPGATIGYEDPLGEIIGTWKLS